MQLSDIRSVLISLCALLAVSSAPSIADTNAQKQKDNAAEAQAKSNAQAAQGHPVRAARQAKKAEEATQQAHQDQAKSAVVVSQTQKSTKKRSRKHH